MRPKHLIKLSSLEAIRAMKIKTSLRFHLTQVRMARTYKTKQPTIHSGEDMWKEELHSLSAELQPGTASLENQCVEISPKAKIKYAA